MRRSAHHFRLLRVALLALPLASMLAACETLESLNPMEEKKTPLAGDRRQVFPQGVPGVEFNAPPTQPSNSNVQIPPHEPNAATDATTAPNNPNAANNEDPWAGQRR